VAPNYSTFVGWVLQSTRAQATKQPIQFAQLRLLVPAPMTAPEPAATLEVGLPAGMIVRGNTPNQLAAFERSPIGQRHEQVDIIAPQRVKRVIVRSKYRHKLNRELAPVIAPAPARPVAGGYTSAGLLAWVALSKYVDHLPLFRLEKMSARWGASLSRQTMVDWIGITAEWLEPIYKTMHQRLLAGSYLQADETPIRCNDPDEKKAPPPKTGCG